MDRLDSRGRDSADISNRRQDARWSSRRKRERRVTRKILRSQSARPLPLPLRTTSRAAALESRRLSHFSTLGSRRRLKRLRLARWLAGFRAERNTTVFGGRRSSRCQAAGGLPQPADTSAIEENFPRVFSATSQPASERANLPTCHERPRRRRTRRSQRHDDDDDERGWRTFASRAPAGIARRRSFLQTLAV